MTRFLSKLALGSGVFVATYSPTIAAIASHQVAIGRPEVL